MRIRRRVRWPMLRAPSILGGVALLAAFAAGLRNSRAGEPPLADIAAATAQTSASSLFLWRCARCHDEDGTGSVLRSTIGGLPNFADLPWQRQRSDAQLVVTILEGKGTRMPAFGGRLSRAEARALVGHIRNLAPDPMVDTGEPARDFQTQFQALQEEFERLRKHFHDLAGSRK